MKHYTLSDLDVHIATLINVSDTREFLQKLELACQDHYDEDVKVLDTDVSLVDNFEVLIQMETEVTIYVKQTWLY